MLQGCGDSNQGAMARKSAPDRTPDKSFTAANPPESGRLAIEIWKGSTGAPCIVNARPIAPAEIATWFQPNGRVNLALAAMLVSECADRSVFLSSVTDGTTWVESTGVPVSNDAEHRVEVWQFSEQGVTLAVVVGTLKEK